MSSSNTAATAAAAAATLVNQAHPHVRALLSAFDKLGDQSISEFKSSIPETFGEVVAKIASQKMMASDFILRNRMRMKESIEKFHREADTLTPSVRESIDLLDDPTTKIVVSTHQPNLFAYGGVFKKIVLLEGIRKKSASSDFGKVVNLFLIVDHDFVDETWIRMAQLPSIRHSSGIMELRVPVGDSMRWLMVCNMPLPAKNIVNSWKHQIKLWIRYCTGSDLNKRREANSNLDQFWQDVVEPSYSSARSYSDLNAFISSKLVNTVWGYGTLFVRLSQMSHVFENGFNFLLSNFGIYSDALRGIEARMMSKDIDTGVGSATHQNAPVWVHCTCGSKASTRIVRHGLDLYLDGPCISCKKHLELCIGRQDNLELSKSAGHLSPRAIPIPLLLSRDLGISCYASGTGGIGYLVDGSIVAKKLSIGFPLVTIWASKDRYAGIGQLAASNREGTAGAYQDIEERLASLRSQCDAYQGKIQPLLAVRRDHMAKGEPADRLLSEIFSLKEEQRSIRQEISYLVKARNVSRVAPCIIDHIANFGMSRVEQAWSDHLAHDGRLASPVIFR